MVRAFVTVVLLGATLVHAQFLEGRGRLLLSAGGAGRSYVQEPATTLKSAKNPSIEIGNASFTNLHLSGAWFFHRNVGVDVEGRFERFFAEATSGACAAKREGECVPQLGGEVTASALGRLLARDIWSFELKLGWGVIARPAITYKNTAALPSGVTEAFTGPSATLGLTLWPARGFHAQFLAGLAGGFHVGSNANLRQFVQLALGLQLSALAVHIGPLQLGLAGTAEAVFANAIECPGVEDCSESTKVATYSQFAVRVGLGLSFDEWLEDTTPEKRPPSSSVEVFVHNADGSPARNATARLDDASETITTDQSGHATLLFVKPGSHHVVAEREGFSAGSVDFIAPVAAGVTVTLGPPTGPGRLLGTVKQGEVPLGGATLTAVESGQSTRSAADGTYTFEKVGPGPVTVRVKADGFKDAEEIAQVAAGGTATLDVVMVPSNASVRATLRGLIRAKNGESVRATVRVVELKLKLTVQGDGRFSAEVPKGKYTLIIEAKGFVSQTKSVEVSEGDQAIFHTELERVR